MHPFDQGSRHGVVGCLVHLFDQGGGHKVVVGGCQGIVAMFNVTFGHG